MTVDGEDILGQPLARIEDPPLVTGRGRFAGDIDFPGQLHMRMVRSPHAHAGIGDIDAAAALALKGVHAVWSAADIAEIPPIDFRSDRQVEALKPFRQHVLAQGRARYVGEPVAAVFAGTPYVAEDAAELVEVGYDPLPATVAADGETGEFAPGVGTEATLLTHTFGDAGAGFARAHAVVSLDLRTGRHSGVPMETRGAIGVYDAGSGRLELHGAAKVPHRNKETLIRMLGLDSEQIHLHEGHVGGGFGIRGELYPEDLLVLLAARRFARPVKWIEDRQEHLMAANQGREQRHKARLAVDEEGRILALETEIWHDQGAYLRTHGVSVPNRSMCSLPGLYRVPAFRASCRVRLTNKAPAATYRAPGRFESSFVRERLMDAAAHRLGIDPVEIRRRNLIAPADLPCTIAYDEPYAETLPLDSGDYPLLLKKALEAVGWDGLRADLARRRAAGELVGAGSRDVPGGERPRPLRRRADRRGRGRPRSRSLPAAPRSGRVSRPRWRRSAPRPSASTIAFHRGRARTDRPDSLRDRGACRPRDGDDGKRRARHGARGARKRRSRPRRSCCRRRPGRLTIRGGIVQADPPAAPPSRSAKSCGRAAPTRSPRRSSTRPRNAPSPTAPTSPSAASIPAPGR